MENSRHMVLILLNRSTVVRKACFRRRGCKARKRRRNYLKFCNFMLLNVGNANLKSELGNICYKMEKIKNLMLKHGIFKIGQQNKPRIVVLISFLALWNPDRS